MKPVRLGVQNILAFGFFEMPHLLAKRESHCPH